MKILLIQTAFIGDVILATGVLEKLHHTYPAAKLDILVRKGNEGLFNGHPYIHEVLIWEKDRMKYRNLFNLAGKIRSSGYEYVLNLQRFGSSGFLTATSRARHKIGFDKNPFSFFFTKKVKHDIGQGKHEIERNHELIRELTDDKPAKPKLYPTAADEKAVASYQQPGKTYLCMAPASVWFTKQYPEEKWVELIRSINPGTTIYLIGAPGDSALCERILTKAAHPGVRNLAGKLSFLESAALLKGAQMNYVNDSAPMHLASAMNAPVTAIYCSTVPAFGFGPLSTQSHIVETKVKLECRPCGLHGFKACPKGHFKCAMEIQVEQFNP